MRLRDGWFGGWGWGCGEEGVAEGLDGDWGWDGCGLDILV